MTDLETELRELAEDFTQEVPCTCGMFERDGVHHYNCAISICEAHKRELTAILDKHEARAESERKQEQHVRSYVGEFNPTDSAEPEYRLEYGKNCNVCACHCDHSDEATHLIGPFNNDSYERASRVCAEMHVMAGYRSRLLTASEKACDDCEHDWSFSTTFSSGTTLYQCVKCWSKRKETER
jgi:hypothetical protein